MLPQSCYLNHDSEAGVDPQYPCGDEVSAIFVLFLLNRKHEGTPYFLFSSLEQVFPLHSLIKPACFFYSMLTVCQLPCSNLQQQDKLWC